MRQKLSQLNHSSGQSPGCPLELSVLKKDPQTRESGRHNKESAAVKTGSVKSAGMLDSMPAI